MEDSSDTLIIVLVLFGVGVAAWWLINRKPLAPAEPPCNVNVAYSGVGVGIPCGAIEDGYKVAQKVVTGIGDAVMTPLKPVGTTIARSLGMEGEVPPCGPNTKYGEGWQAKMRIDLDTGVACGRLGDEEAATAPAAAPMTRTAAERSALLSRTLGTAPTRKL